MTTFNVRDRRAEEYLKFLHSVRKELASRPHAGENIAAHEKTQPARLKICFPFFCWQQANANGFEQDAGSIHVYHSISDRPENSGRLVRHTLVHFHQRFNFRRAGVLPAPALAVLTDIANLTLHEMKEEIPYRLLIPPQIILD